MAPEAFLATFAGHLACKLSEHLKHISGREQLQLGNLASVASAVCICVCVCWALLPVWQVAIARLAAIYFTSCNWQFQYEANVLISSARHLQLIAIEACQHTSAHKDRHTYRHTHRVTHCVKYTTCLVLCTVHAY